ncbi:MAG: phage baseplate assembly family protein [Rhodocyclales bacterium]|nr:phage baseplate assembly family protein [Rhodocyclales bacterium]
MIAMIDTRIKRLLAGMRLPFRGRGSVVSSTGPVQMVHAEGLKDENLPDMELFQHYGFTSRPPKGFMYVATPIGGKTSHGIVIATEHGQYRFKALADGEAALYSDEGDSVVLHRGRTILVTTKTLRINAEDLVEINTKQYNVNASVSSTITTPNWTVVASTKATYTTPLVAMSAQLSVAGLLTGTGGCALSGTAPGGANTMAGNFAFSDGTLTHDGHNIDGLHGHRTHADGSLSDGPE